MSEWNFMAAGTLLNFKLPPIDPYGTFLTAGAAATVAAFKISTAPRSTYCLETIMARICTKAPRSVWYPADGKNRSA